MNNEEREALLAEAHDGDVDPGAAADLPLLADLLADPAMWEEPSADLKGAVLQAVASAPSAEPKPAAEPKRRRAVLYGALAVAAAIVFAVAVFAVVRSSSNADYNAQLSASGAV